jgi:eukaryotic-like serine/threonine-protein kinase
VSGDPTDDASVLATQLLKGKPGPDLATQTPRAMPSVASSAIEQVETHDTSPGTNEPSAMARLRVADAAELARGGMGSVHRVQDPAIGRWVALKRVDADQARKSPEVAHLLLEEAQITGQLEHPNIVPIYDLGNDEHGFPMFTMKLVQGQTLTALIGLSERRGHGPHQLRAILDALVKACDAIAYAHDKGVIHRDLKPDNIMVGSYGQVYVVDWGCALVKSDPPGRSPGESVRVHSAGTARTSPEAVLGTVAYMAPEQARGHLGLIDERSDVYSLGAILYQVLTRRPPHRGKDAQHSMQMAQAGDVVAPQELRPHFEIPGQLAQICMKALAPLPQDRYQSVLDLRDALKDFLAGGTWLPHRRFLAGDIIIAEGEPGDAAYIIVSGTCEASRQIQGTSTVIRRMGPGDVFGETAILTDQPRSATVTAVSTNVVVTVITREAVEGELSGSSWVGAFARALAGRFREAERRADASNSLAGRIVDAIRVHVLAGGVVKDGQLEASWPPLRAAIATAFGVAEHQIDESVGATAEISVVEARGVIRLAAT